jgi:hypothetical protein
MSPQILAQPIKMPKLLLKHGNRSSNSNSDSLPCVCEFSMIMSFHLSTEKKKWIRVTWPEFEGEEEFVVQWGGKQRISHKNWEEYEVWIDREQDWSIHHHSPMDYPLPAILMKREYLALSFCNNISWTEIIAVAVNIWGYYLCLFACKWVLLSPPTYQIEEKF